jgi:phospholipase A1
MKSSAGTEGVFSMLVCSAFLCLELTQPAVANDDISSLCALKYLGDDVGRLKCYDQMTASAVQKKSISNKEAEASIPPLAAQTISYERSYLTKVWNLDDQTNWDASELSRIQPYRQSYFLVNSTSDPNIQPYSPAIGRNTQVPENIDASEIKFQLSFKADIGSQRNLDFLGIKTFRMWGAYTQQSYWQAFNNKNTSPFRETNYEPELIATLGTGHESGLKLINLGLVHQSNGQTFANERSWNRIYLLGGWEWNDTTSVLLRRWQRIPEASSTDDNPDIIDYLGRGDLVIRWEPKDESQSVALLLRNNLNMVDNRGYFQIDWATPVKLGHVARMHIQMTSGYGESLIDYNHRQNSIGIGVSSREW